MTALAPPTTTTPRGSQPPPPPPPPPTAKTTTTTKNAAAVVPPPPPPPPPPKKLPSPTTTTAATAPPPKSASAAAVVVESSNSFDEWEQVAAATPPPVVVNTTGTVATATAATGTTTNKPAPPPPPARSHIVAKPPLPTAAPAAAPASQLPHALSSTSLASSSASSGIVVDGGFTLVDTPPPVTTRDGTHTSTSSSSVASSSSTTAPQSSSSWALVVPPPVEAAGEASNSTTKNDNDDANNATTASVSTALASSPFVSSFHFVADERRVQSEWDAWEEHALRRQQNFQTRIHSLERRIAKVSCRLAHEAVDRQEQLQAVRHHALQVPLTHWVDEIGQQYEHQRYASAEQLQDDDQDDDPPAEEIDPVAETNETDHDNDHDETTTTTTTTTPTKSLLSPRRKLKFPPPGSLHRWMSLERRLALLSAHMTRSIHVELPDARRQQLHDLQEQTRLLHQTLQRHRRESQQRFAVLVGRLESLAGLAQSQLQEQQAARTTAFTTTQDRYWQTHQSHRTADEQRWNGLWEQLGQLQRQLTDEQVQRAAHDQLLRRKIEATAHKMQRALLEAAGDPDDNFGFALEDEEDEEDVVTAEGHVVVQSQRIN